MHKYKHTFHLIDGSEIVGYAENSGILHITFGNETAFFVENGKITYKIPFFSVSHIETEELE